MALEAHDHLRGPLFFSLGEYVSSPSPWDSEGGVPQPGSPADLTPLGTATLLQAHGDLLALPALLQPCPWQQAQFSFIV